MANVPLWNDIVSSHDAQPNGRYLLLVCAWDLVSKGGIISSHMGLCVRPMSHLFEAGFWSGDGSCELVM